MVRGLLPCGGAGAGRRRPARCPRRGCRSRARARPRSPRRSRCRRRPAAAAERAAVRAIGRRAVMALTVAGRRGDFRLPLPPLWVRRDHQNGSSVAGVTSRLRHLTLLFSLVAVLSPCSRLAGPRQPGRRRRPDLQRGQARSARSYSLARRRPNGSLAGAEPVTDQDAGRLQRDRDAARRSPVEGGCYSIRLTRFDIDGLPTGFDEPAMSRSDRSRATTRYEELLDMRDAEPTARSVVLTRGLRERGDSQSDMFLRYHFDANGADDADSDTWRTELPADCEPVRPRRPADSGGDRLRAGRTSSRATA